MPWAWSVGLWYETILGNKPVDIMLVYPEVSSTTLVIRSQSPIIIISHVLRVAKSYNTS